MDALLGSHSTAGQTIQVLSYQMREFAKEPYTIQKRLTTFSSNISAFAEWTLSVREQPLEIDYFILSDASGSYKAKNDNLFDSVKREVSAFWAPSPRITMPLAAARKMSVRSPSRCGCPPAVTRRRSSTA